MSEKPEFVKLRGIWPLEGDVLARRETLYSIQGYFHYAIQAGSYYDKATHYIVAGPYDEDKLEVARPNTTVVCCVRLNKRRIDQDFVEDWIVIRKGDKETTWKILTSGIHKKTDVVTNAHYYPRNIYSHLHEGEEVFFVCKRPIPEDIGYKLIPWRGRLD